MPRHLAAWRAAVLSALSMTFCGGAGAVSIQSARDKVVSQTLAYLNAPYLWGGRRPDTGIDCSAFVQLVYGEAGLGLPRVAREQFRVTKGLRPDDVLPGDLVFFSMAHPGSSRVDHVGVYMGRGFFVHASVANGVHIEPIAKPYYLDRLVGIRKYRGF